MPKVKDFYQKLDEIAPFQTAESWDNVGLQVGELSKEVTGVLLSLDITDSVVDLAIKRGANLIICHHPVIFQGIKNVTDPLLLRLIENHIAVIVAHTNLDYSPQGVNTALAEALQLKDIYPLSPANHILQYQISVCAPPDSSQKVLFAMLEAGAGIVGNYSDCGTFYPISGQYKPLAGSQPFIGEIDSIEKSEEVKIEVHCYAHSLSKVIAALCQAHPYETPGYYVIPLAQKSLNYGLGAVGILDKEMKISQFADFVKDRLNAPFVRVWYAKASGDTLVQKVAVCGGAGNIVIGQAAAKADVFVTSDLSYHQFLAAPLPVIDAGHFYTENIVLPHLKAALSGLGAEIEVGENYQKLEIRN